MFGSQLTEGCVLSAVVTLFTAGLATAVGVFLSLRLSLFVVCCYRSFCEIASFMQSFRYSNYICLLKVFTNLEESPLF